MDHNHRYRFADNVRAAYDYDLGAGCLEPRAYDQLLYSSRGAGQKLRLFASDHQASDIDRVEAINIFIRINGVEDLLFIDMLRHRQLDKYAVNLRVFVVLIDKLEKIGLGYFSRLAVLDRVKTDFMCCFLLGCDITDRRRVLAYEDCNQTGNYPVLLLHLGYFNFEFFPDLCCYFCSTDDFGCH